MRVKNKEIPPTPKPPTESKIELSQSQAEEIRPIEVSSDPWLLMLGQVGRPKKMPKKHLKLRVRAYLQDVVASKSFDFQSL